MILDALTAEIDQRFQHEKRAQVCLWFDPSQEFARLLPSLKQHLTEHPAPPFHLFEYNLQTYQGQVWLKYQIHTGLAGLPETEQKLRRFLIYLTLPEDRLDTPDERGEHHLELLEEYRRAGVIWRIDGKRPTLFRFLRRAGVGLPAKASDQRQLYDGGFDSLLAKYVAKFADRPAIWWDTPLTPAVAQTRLLGDIDQTLIALATVPETTWNELREHGLDSELMTAVAERYEFTHPTEPPAAWVQAFVAIVALTETYQGYDEPEDFPFADRLPSPLSRTHYLELLKRWLRDSEGRVAWDRWVREVEKDIDLSAWAAQREGLAFAFPHIVRLRWQQTLDALHAAADKTSATEAFFAEHRERIKLESEYSRASDHPIGAWALLLHLADFLEACRLAEHAVAGADGAGELAQVYVRNAGRVEQQHLDLRRQAEEHGLSSVTMIVDRHYAAYTNALNDRFFKSFAQQGHAQQGDTEIANLPAVTAKLERDLWAKHGRRAVVIVDALRYDCALAIQDQLRDHDVIVEPMRAELPTITPVGMTALMPLASATVTLEVKGNNIHPRVDGKDCAQRKQRLAFMTAFGADCRDIGDLEARSTAADDLGELLVVFGHDEVDHIGHGSADTLVRHVDLEVQRIGRLIHKLHRWGYPAVHVVTDHGFILLEESKLPDIVACDKDWCHVRKQRFALIPATADLPLTSFPATWDPSMRIAVPPGLAFFKAEKSFSHGGAALQELIIPHLISKTRSEQGKRIGVEVVVPTYKLTRAAVKVVLRPAAGKKEQLSLFTTIATETGRTLALDVRRTDEPAGTVLATPKAKEIRLEAKDTEKSVTLFFHTAESFHQGELLDLDIRDIDTDEQFPPGGLKLSVGRDL